MKAFRSILAVTLLGTCVTACTGQILNKDGPGGPAVNKVNLERVFQEVVRYDCNHNVISDQIETVQSPTRWVTIPAYNPDSVYTSGFQDEETGSSAGLITGFQTFQVDYSYGALNMHVVDGVNVIDYAFYSCTQWTTDPSGNQICTAKQVAEQGTSTINVSYSEETLPGTSEINECDSSH